MEFGFWRKEISSKVGLDCYSCSGCGCEIFCDVGRKPNICICPNCDLDMVNSNVKVTSGNSVSFGEIKLYVKIVNILCFLIAMANAQKHTKALFLLMIVAEKEN